MSLCSKQFCRQTLTSTLAAVLRQEPEAPSRVTPNVPRELERIIQRCLRKDANRRFHSMSDVKVELEEVREESASGAAAIPAAPRRRRWLWVSGVAAAIAAMGLVALWARRGAGAQPPGAPVPLTAYRGDERMPDFSPDGAQVVFAWNGEHADRFHIYVKLIGSANHLQLTNGNGSDTYPAWSPDGRWIAFQRADGAVSRTMLVSPIGGPDQAGDSLCTVHMS